MPPYEFWWHGGWWFMWIIPFAFFVLFAVFLFRAGSMCGWRPRRDRDSGQDSAQDILARRFAGGEITKDQYDDMRRTLEK